MINRTPRSPRCLSCLRKARGGAAGFILLVALYHAHNAPVTVLVHANGGQDRDVLHLTAPAPLQHAAIQVHIGMRPVIGWVRQRSMCLYTFWLRLDTVPELTRVPTGLP